MHCVFLESQALIAVGEIDDAAVGEAVFLKEVLHDFIVAVGIDADVGVNREAILHRAGEDAPCLRGVGSLVRI